MVNRRDKSDLRPIPIRLSHRWRSIRYQLLPVVVFGVAAVLGFRLLGQRAEQPGSVVGIARGRVFQVSAAYAGRIRNMPVRLCMSADTRSVTRTVRSCATSRRRKSRRHWPR